MICTLKPFTPHGTIVPPSSKSYTHRYLIAAFIHGTKVTIENVNYSDDVLYTLDALKELGGIFEQGNNFITFIKREKSPDNVTINVGSSASTLRILLPLASHLAKKVKIIGSETLFERPLQTYVEMFEDQSIPYQIGKNYIEFEGKIALKDYLLDASQSSQFCSGMLFLFALTESKNALTIKNLVSKDYLNMTLEVLSAFGNIFVDYSLVKIVDVNISKIYVEKDYSAASNFFVLGALKGDINIRDLNPISTQGDKKITSILEKCGARISYRNNTYSISSSTLQPFELSIKNNIDLGPILIVLASLINGVSSISDYNNLKIKESDRLNNIISQLEPLGIKFEKGKTLKISGKATYEIKQYTFDSCNDHRLAMAFAIFGIVSGIETTILNAKSVLKSYPKFFDDLEALR